MDVSDLQCGLCTGGVRLYRGVLHGRPISDWKHASAPAGTAPHRPVIGTPVDIATLDRIHRPVQEEQHGAVQVEVAPPLVTPRPAKAEELEDSQSATQVVKLLKQRDWELIEDPAYFQTAAGVEHLVVKARRRDLGVLVTWRRRPERNWELEFAMRLAPGLTRQVGSEQLKQWIGQRDEQCPDCGRSSVVHEGGECP